MNAAAITLVVIAFITASLHIGLAGKPRGNYHPVLGLMDLALTMFLMWQAGLFK